MTQNAIELRGKALLRQQALLSGFMCLFSALIYFAVEFPFPTQIAGLSLLAAAVYFAYYLFFDLVCTNCYGAGGAVLSAVGVVTLTLVVNFSGGILSPFIFLYFCILISEALYGLENPVTLPLALAGYLLVVWGQFAGLFQHTNAWASEIYRSALATLLITAVTVVYLVLTRRITQLIVTNLRVRLEQGTVEKDALLRKFSELNATAQIGVLAHRIAHDLRGPISSISGYIQVEMVKEKSPEDKKTLQELSSVVDGMSDSLHGITRFGKEAGGRNRESIILGDFIDALLAIVSFSPQAKGVKFTKLYPANTSIAVSGSRADLQQAYFNIVKNSVEAVRGNADGKVVELDIRTEGLEALISVADNGSGVEPETYRSLFARPVTTKKEGTGVGLIITKGLLELNNGSIELRNRESGGVIVTTRLPLA